MNSRITITFNSIPDLDTTFAFTDSLTGTTMTETFKASRTGANESERDGTSEEITAYNYNSAFSLDYNWTSLYSTGVFLLQTGEYQVVILANNLQSQFTLSTNTTNGAISAVIENGVVNNFSIDTVTISEADTDPCNNVKITVNTIETATAITLPISQSVSVNPFVFDYNRSNSLIKIRMNKDSVIDNTDLIVTKLLSTDFNINVYNTPTTGSAQVQRLTSQGLLIFEYSINNVDWQSNTSFTNLAVADYTMYIRDNIGCSISIPFSITSFNPSINDYDAISEVSNLNPLRYKQVEDWTNCGTLRNVDNTLSFEENTFVNQKNFTQKFQKCDIVNTQIKTNYENVTARILTCDDLPVEANENLLLYSEQIDNAYWIKEDTSVTSNVDGDADKIVALSFSGLKIVSSLTDKAEESLTYTLSAHVKSAEYSRVYIRMTNEAQNSGYAAYFNLNDQSFNSISGNWTFVSSNISDEGDGWYRISMTVISDSSDKIESVFGIVDDLGSPFFTGDNSSGILINKAQLRQGNLSDYIETTDSQVFIDETPAGLELTVEQRTENINITDVRDAFIFQITGSENYNNYVGLKYGSGNTYNPVDLLQNGTYVLDLPDWIDVGEYISTPFYGWFQVLDIITINDESVIVFNEQFSNTTIDVAGESTLASSVYNILDYERYEFAIDFSGFNEGYYKVQIDLQDDNFGTKQYLSEWIDLKEIHNNCYVIQYQNSENNEINFNTGFTGILRIPYVNQLKYKPSEEQDIYVTDNNTVLLDTQVRDFFEFSLKPLPTMMAQKITLVSSLDRLFIDGISYLKTGELDVTPIGSTNEYIIKGTLVRVNYVFNATEFVSNSELVTTDGTPISINTDSQGFLFAGY